MGLEISLNRNREATNNLPPIRFHSVHGENIRITSDGAIARRVESFCKGITFSNRPIRVNERVYLKFVDISSNWSGAVRFGFTNNDPNTCRNNLPKYACPDLRNRPGNWAKALAERLAQRDSTLYFYYNEEGEVHYNIDGEDKGVFFSDMQISPQMWAIIDVYGNTCALELVDPRSNSGNVRTRDMNHLVSQLSNSSISRENREPLPQIYCNVALNPILFHRTKGCNVRLTNDRCIAERNSSHYCQGYVFTQRPLNLEEKLVFQILQTDGLYTGSLAFGLTTCNPSSINGNDLPEDAHQLLERPEYWVIIKDVATAPVAGDELAVKICDNGEVKLYKNRQPPTTLMHVDQTQKLYAFFDLYGSTIKIKLLGTIIDIHNMSQSQLNHILPGYQPLRLLSETSSSNLSVCLPLKDKSNCASQHGSESNSNAINLGECTVCYEKPINSVLYICGHMCMCYECAFKQWKGTGGGQCPICRAMIQDVIRTYVS
ncbi:protein neuralized-like protein [Dinothrombium tinctorium]|uniref:Protein neuralized n=1 Tax=Dinothrombium tinctorium TaxID=1965070 RepID=A0A3S3PAW9_9ACAR|nr:protein neuralized-like protein [Dinothrombium tinctorium]RWS16524.1 protein neuralized-like protein [Dinothrombium tinctorium]